VAGAKAAAEPASRVAMASFIMVAGVLFCYGETMESARRQATTRRAALGFCVCRWLNMYLCTEILIPR